MSMDPYDRYESPAEEERRSSSEDAYPSTKNRNGVPGWLKWVILGGCLCFLLVICVSTIQKSRYESQHWFDGVEEAGFHEEAAGPGAEETAQWVLDASKWTIGNFKSIEVEGGYYQYYLSSYDTLSAVPPGTGSRRPPCTFAQRRRSRYRNRPRRAACPAADREGFFRAAGQFALDYSFIYEYNNG